jgi:hypothetical protein
LAIPSFAASLMSALPEALAAAGLVGGFLCWQNRRLGLAAALFGAALLVRETGIILLAAVVVAGGRREWKASLPMLGAAVAPVGAWRGFVAWRLFADFGWAAIIANPHDLGVPFGGLMQLWHAGSTGLQPAPEIAGALLFPLILAAAFVLAVSLLLVRGGPLALAAATYAAVAVSLNYGQIWSHLPSGERGAFELFICLLLLLLESKDWPGWIRRTLTGLFVVLVGYTFFIAVDAPTSRAALLLIR